MRTLSILKTVSAVATVSAIAITATTGKASAITFKLGGSSVLNPGSITQNGIQLTSSASATPRGDNPVLSSQVIRQNGGLGVATDTRDFSSDNNQVDGRRAIETLTLAFNQFVRLTSVTFTSVGSNDNFVFINGLNIGASQPISISGNPQSGDNNTGIFTTSVTGFSFGFRASQANDDFFISSVDVEAVPEPITIAGMMMGSGFGVLLFKKYKKGVKFSTKLRS